MAASLTLPSHDRPTAKEKKYDRQLRLWAASGQQALEEAHVLLLNAGSGVVGVETLKNLVLPGIGNFTIVDENLVVEQDLGVNFFLEDESLGKARAEECCRFLRELNPEVNGFAVRQSVRDFVSETNLSKYTLILVVGPNAKDVVVKLSQFASQSSVPLFYVNSIGFYSHFSLQLPELFPIVDTHPDPDSTQDLHLLNPWPELLEHMRLRTKDLESMSDHEHGHIPYLLLLLYFLDEWSTSHGGKHPNSYKEKTTLRTQVQAAARTGNAEGGEENFDEAVAAVLKSLNPPTMPSGLKEIVMEEECKNPSPDSANFWLMSHAIEIFFKTNGVLPLSGALPDMKSQSTDYVNLQHIYRIKAQKDTASVTATIRNLELKLQRQSPIDDKEIQAFCKGAAFVKLMRGRKIQILDQASVINWDGSEGLLVRELEDENSLIGVYLVIMALGSVVGNSDAALSDPASLIAACDDPAFFSKMKNVIIHTVGQLRAHNVELDTDSVVGRLENIIKEVQRTGPVELHNISSLTGGLVAQEIIKVITKQYIPIDNTCVFDGITSRTAVFRL